MRIPFISILQTKRATDQHRRRRRRSVWYSTILGLAKFKGRMPSFPLILRTSSKWTSGCSRPSPKLSLFVNRRTFYSLGILAASVAFGVRHERPFVPQRVMSGAHKLYHYSSTHFTSLRNLAAFGSRRNLFLSTSPDMSHISTLNLPQKPLKCTHTPEEVLS